MCRVLLQLYFCKRGRDAGGGLRTGTHAAPRYVRAAVALACTPATIVVLACAQSPLFCLRLAAGLTWDSTPEPRAADRNMGHGAPSYSVLALRGRFLLLCPPSLATSGDKTHLSQWTTDVDAGRSASNGLSAALPAWAFACWILPSFYPANT